MPWRGTLQVQILDLSRPTDADEIDDVKREGLFGDEMFDRVT